MIQAQKAQGNIHASTRTVDGIHHTLSVWEDEAAMRRYLVAGAHRKAMAAFASLGTGSTYGYLTHTLPDWDTALALWHSHAKKVG